MTATPANTTIVGSLDASRVARVDEHGTIAIEGSGVRIRWWIGADGRWYRPDEEPSTRQYRVDALPIVETALRVPGGDALQRVYGAAGGLLVIEVENASPAPLALALVVEAGALEADERGAALGGHHRLSLMRRAGVSQSSPDLADLWSTVSRGAATEADGRGGAHALIFPVAHRTRWRAAVALDRPDGADILDLGGLPAPTDAARGWERQLDRGMRMSVADRAVNDAVRCARAETLLLAASGSADPSVCIALEDWGFDDEAEAVWSRLTMRARRVARRRDTSTDPWLSLREPASPAATLRAARAVLLDDRGSHIDIVPGFRADWLGVPLTVEDAPTRFGLISFAVRWHGPRPALLWDAPEGVELRMPTLAPDITCAGGQGETLLPEPSIALLGLGKDADAVGERFEPESFS